MAGRQGQAVLLQAIGRLFEGGPISGLGDDELLEKFVARRDEAAFAALVTLHGPAVLGVCRRILRDPHDIEDAFQATFLVLVRRADSIRDPRRLGPWLHGVARRVALRARSDSARRAIHGEKEGADRAIPAPAPEAERAEVRDAIDAEVGRLPARYRDAVVLCDLEGRSYAEAARRLRCPLGTVQSRLARARKRLRVGLARRGLAPVAGGLAVSDWLGESASAAVPAALREAAVRGAIATALGRSATAGAVPATAAALMTAALRGMAVASLKTAATAAVVVASLLLGGGLLARGMQPADRKATLPDSASPLRSPVQKVDQQPTSKEFAVSGIILRPDGQPASKATVIVHQLARRDPTARIGADERGRYEQANQNDTIIRTKTDEQGRFEIGRSLDPSLGGAMITAFAPGFAWAEVKLGMPPEKDRSLRLVAPIPSVTLRFAPRNPLRGRVVDSKGKPVDRARVIPVADANHGYFDLQFVTDRDGRFEWSEAPTAGTLLFDVGGPFTGADSKTPPLCGISGLKLDATDSRDITITLRRMLRLHGTVTDAASGKPVELFSLTSTDDAGQRDWLRPVRWRQEGGRFEYLIQPHHQSMPRSIRIEADGYLAEDVHGIRDDSEDVRLDFKLRRATPDPKPAEKPEPGTGQTLDLSVVDGATREPLAGAKVWVQTTTVPGRETRGAADAGGHYPIAYAGKSFKDPLVVVVAHPGYVPIELRWSALEPTPPAYTVALERGDEIGGTVQDQWGRPLAGARVLPRCLMVHPNGFHEIYVTTGEEVAGAITDAQGRWRSHALPSTAGPDVPISLRVSHPNRVVGSSRVTAAEARAGTSIQVLRGGFSLSGAVLRPDGKPAPGATVIIRTPGHAGTMARLESDRDGRFQSGFVLDPDRHEAVVTAVASGFAWSETSVKYGMPSESNRGDVGSLLRKDPAALFGLPMPSVTIRLTSRQPLRGRVVDSKGKPVAGASVVPTTELDGGQYDWEALTDADGRFDWFEAPTSGALQFNVTRAPFEQALGRRFEATGSREIAITLHRPLHLHGTVTDAETGKPVEQFTVTPGWYNPGGRTDWLRTGRRWPKSGKFEFDGGLFPDQGQRRSIRIEAEGYLPGELLGFRDDAEEIAHDFKLRPAKPLTGIVRGPDGHPLAGAEVALSGPEDRDQLKNGRWERGQVVGGGTATTTGPDGRYTFKPQAGKVGIVVVHDSGFGYSPPDAPANSTDITVKPWGRIQGTLRIGSRPAYRRKVAAWLINPWIYNRVDYETTTNDQGEFTIDRVVPYRVGVYRYVDTRDRTGWVASNQVNVNVAPGETVRVDIGGTGRPVVGKLKVPEGVALGDFVLGHGSLAAERPDLPYPDDFPDFTPEQRSAWHAAFQKSPAGQAHLEGERQYAVKLNPDGTIWIDDVPAGRYVLKLPFNDRVGQEHNRPDRQAYAKVEVVVPAIPGGRSDQALDIGEVPLAVFPINRLRVGEVVPSIPDRAADGRPLGLDAYRGKFVLLAFWTTDRPETRVDMQHFKAVHDAFGRDPRFAMIGLNQNVDPEFARRYAARHGYTWEQRYLGSLYEPNPIPASLGVSRPPDALLIGPDGRLIAKDLRGGEILAAVMKALKPEE